MNTESAKNAVEFCRIAGRDKDGKANWIEVPGHKAKRYFVKIRRIEHNGDIRRLDTDCWLDTMKGKQLCPSIGNKAESLCYHVLAAIMVVAEDAGYQVIWCSDKDGAKRLSNIRGSTFHVTSKYSNADAWGVFVAV